MHNTLKFLLALAAAFVAMLAFRALAFTVYAVDDAALAPEFVAGDRVMVNRWSYGLRAGGGLFSYGRICRQPVRRGDLVAFELQPDSADECVVIGRCAAVPGDTVTAGGQTLVVPGVASCADQDYYWMEPVGDSLRAKRGALGFVAERDVIGRAFLIVYSHEPGQPFWRDYLASRFLLLK